MFIQNNTESIWGRRTGVWSSSPAVKKQSSGPFPLLALHPMTAIIIHSQSCQQVLIHLHLVHLSFSSITHYLGNEGKAKGGGRGRSSEMRPPQMRKTMPSDSMTWLSSCILSSAAWISSAEKGSSLPWLMDSVRRVRPTDCAWASWNTFKRAALKAFNLPQREKR